MSKPILEIDHNLARAILLLDRMRRAAFKPAWQEGESATEVSSAVYDFITDMRLEHGWSDDYEGFLPAVLKVVGKTEESEIE